MNEPLEMTDRGFTVTVSGKKVYADYEIRDMTIRCVSVQAATIWVYDTMTPNCVLFINICLLPSDS